MMSMKCKYAIKALIRLGKNYEQGYLLIKDIAEVENIPKKFLEQILLTLKRAGYVGSRQGNKGGYYLATHPKQINVADIYRLFDGAIALIPCAAVQYYEKCDDCVNEVHCAIRREFMKIREQTRLVMKKTTLQSFLNPARKNSGKRQN